jgi:hypothetical protein
MADKNDNIIDADEVFDGAEIVDVVDAGELPDPPGDDGVDESPQQQASLGVNDLHLMAMIIQHQVVKVLA